ncbi:hypothetical protein CAPTEDRAFT_210926 [Capitella teleta]|uniref:Uncharacterized protein n=1 Tax=Capitella teleta TaxID=283909 RepID=R7VDT0_CAPTE|nr:hypothetical protein CAPTEDRAFT_210926 [Capitella teleta]|eukprot:ELU14471.1 hypothetical protein CAPTEDRAFT_210926 [Capitella teleta]
MESATPTSLAMKREHRSHHIFMVIVNFFIFLALFVIICMIISDYDEGVFAKPESELRLQYEFTLILTPLKNGLEIVIYAWQLVWLLYNVVLLTRESVGGYLYYSPEYLPFTMNVSFSALGILNIVWLFLWSSQKLVAEISVFLVMVVLCLFSFVITVRKLNEHGLQLLQQNLKLDVILTRLLVHNGLMAINTYLWLHFFAHLGLVLLTEGVLSTPDDAITLALGLMAVFIIIESIITIFMFDRYTRYLFSTYIVQIWMFSTMIDFFFDGNNRNSVIVAILLALSIGLLLIKIYRVFRASCVNAEPLLDGIELEDETDEVEIDNVEFDGEINLPPLQPQIPPNVEIFHFMGTDMPGNVPSQPGYRRPPQGTFFETAMPSQPGYRRPPPRTYGPCRAHTRQPHGRVHYTVRGAPMPAMQQQGSYRTNVQVENQPSRYRIDPDRVRRY